MQASHLAQIDFICTLLQKGMKRSEIIPKVIEKWPKNSLHTVDRRLTAARKRIKEEYAGILETAQEKAGEEAEKLKKRIMSSLERQAYLSDIIRGKPVLTKPIVVDRALVHVPVVPTWSDRISAINELNKMDGSHAPVKNELDLSDNAVALTEWLTSKK